MITTNTMPALQDFFETLLHERDDCTTTMTITVDNAATHFTSVNNKRAHPKTPPLSPSTQESRWGAIEVSSLSSSRRTSYPCDVAIKVIPCKGSRWNMSIASAPLNCSPLNRRTSYIVSPPQRRMSFDDGPRMVSMVGPARR